MTDRLSYALTVAVPTLVLLLLVSAVPIGMLNTSNLTFDWYQRLNPRVWHAALPVRVVDIDDKSLARFGQWPWPRSTIAKLIDELRPTRRGGRRIDVMFAEPDASSAERVVQSLPKTAVRDQLEQKVFGKKSNDTLLAAAMSTTPTVLATTLTQGARASGYPAQAPALRRRATTHANSCRGSPALLFLCRS